MSPLSLTDFGARVREAREARAWSQQDLADATGLTKKQIWDLENGLRDIRLSSFAKLLDALELPASELIDDIRH